MTDDLMQDGAGTEDILGLGDGDSSELGDGLELDAQQAGEIKSIFLTTLPQYLEPVAEMLDQLFADAGNAEAEAALRATLASLTTAAARIGVDDACKRLQRMGELVAEVGRSGGAVSPDLQEQLLWDLSELRRLSEGTASEEDRSPTLVSALAGHDIDRGVLRQLTAAGVVTVDQMLMARPDEIVAVSGLDLRTVQRVIALLAPPAVDVSDPPPAGAPRPAASNVVELRLDDQTLRAQLEAALKARVDAEAGYDELHGELQRRRQHTADLRRLADAAARTAAELEQELQVADRGVHKSAETLRQLRRRRDELVTRREAVDDQVRNQEARILDLRHQGDAMREQQARFDDAVANLVHHVARMLKIAKGE